MPIETTTCVLGGVVISIVSGALGKVIGANGKVKDATCAERQHACSGILGTKIDGLTKVVDGLKNSIDKIV